MRMEEELIGGGEGLRGGRGKGCAKVSAEVGSNAPLGACLGTGPICLTYSAVYYQSGGRESKV